jgi:divalent metal cation (Fe/Co/Zn/Cd) transporter
VAPTDRQEFVRRGEILEYATILWNSAERVIAILAGALAGSIALVGFGLDSFIEVSSGVVLLWRLHHDRDELRRERREQLALRIVGWCFLALAAYVAWDSTGSLLRREQPEESLVGIVLAAVSLIVMPVLARAKRRVSAQLGSAAMAADARQTDFCMYLSAILLAGLTLNALFGLWWADPVAGLVMVPIIANEGVQALRGKTCCCSDHVCKPARNG